MSRTPFDSSALLVGLSPPAAPKPLGPRPAHVLYGGAHLWKTTTLPRASELALATLAEAAPDDTSFGELFGLSSALARAVRAQVATKLAHAPVDDYRIDFEDGYGVRSDEEEDAAAVDVARSLADAFAARTPLPPFLGIRIRALSGATAARSLRTLDRFFGAWTASAIPAPEALSFVVTLPKVERAAEVSALAAALTGHERALGWAPGTLGLEIMVETPAALCTPDGLALAGLVDAAGSRCRAAHFGAYDYLSSLGVPAEAQGLGHPSCVLARALMKLALVGKGVGLSDGATIVLPLPRDRGTPAAPLDDAQRAGNRRAVRDALAVHGQNVERALREGYLQGWDLHPAQLVARWAAVFAFYARAYPEAAARLRGFVDRAARANALAGAFDDAASALGLVGFFVDGVGLGAFSRETVERDLGVSLDVLAGRDFSQIVSAARVGAAERR